MTDMIVIPEIAIREITNNGNFVHISLEQMQMFVLRADAETFGRWCFITGLIIGILVTYFWYRGRIKKWQPEDR